MSEKRTELSELGEFGLIDKLTKDFKNKNAATIYGIGDDAAVLERDEEHYTLLSTDMMLEGIHFNLMYMPLKHLGYKAVSSNVSDICAMNGTPEHITVSLAVSNRFPQEALEELYEGIAHACDIFNVDLVGGDTTSSVSGLGINIAITGKVKKTDVVYRSGAKENDLIVVTGDLGGAYMGLQILEREKEVYKANPNIQPDLDGHDYILQRQMKPEARTDVIAMFGELKVKPTSMIDISDGLASELLHIAKASDVSCQIYDEKLPIDAKTSMTAMEMNVNPNTAGLNGGEDYELLFTISQKDYETIGANPNFTVIGYISRKGEGSHIVDKNGAAIELTAQGWNHFKD
ncbi:thiamine-phosphate kinase [Crocinitomicaceae bacterium]|jgi:thiamine-monophosphate kinase|nr:thiamine-phosphate kinase [Crocinitomicaceae bacterium]MDG1346737.1 thiamine-phosphate kinase [Crocinitomicaceae bacterium]MDG2465260.1 thiamine-phosphate kinase [Crocinitomicaceae bacterium]